MSLTEFSVSAPAPGPAAAPAPVRPVKANARFMRAHPAHWIALGFGSGLSPVAPGTAGTLWAWVAFLVLQIWCTPAQIGWLIAASLPVGWWACTVTSRHLGTADSGNIVWDEIVAFWAVLWLAMPMGLAGQAIAFGLFRYFDAAKPGPVGWADKVFHGSGARGAFGILFDDLVAAGCTLLVITGWRYYQW